MEQKTIRLTLLEARRELLASIKASEQWHPSYKTNRARFKQLVEAEAQLETDAAEYLFGLSERAVRYVDWKTYRDQLAKQPVKAHGLHAAADPVANKADDVWLGEELNLQRAVIEAINLIATIGVDAALERYGFALEVDSIQDFVAKATREHIAEMVTGVTETSRNKIREAIRQSLARGETSDLAVERIMKTLNNPVRAEMIAQTESVNAYAIGQEQYALETGAKTKTWESLAGACERKCGPIDGQTVAIDKDFTLADGTKVKRPAGHTRCRCSNYYGY
ncbi:phage minor head protein [Rhodococcus erythropolis]|uniref:phage minor head protein n=1 Tax=Rhodococcus erythropolis TaxID=1833 RepID=UPI003014028C